MKKIFYIIIVLLLLNGCGNSSLRYLQKGLYDKSIEKAVKKLLKNPENTHEIEILLQAYNTANQKDKSEIEQLKYSGQPDIWYKIYTLFNNLNSRQEKVGTISKNVLNKISYQHINYNSDIAESKKKAAEYFYAHAKLLLLKNNKYDARIAYEELNNVQSIYQNFRDVNELINQAYEAGCTYVLFQFEKNTSHYVTNFWKNDFSGRNLSELNRKWVTFHDNPDNRYFYNYLVIARLKYVDITPESINRYFYDESKRVTDGWEYMLDKNGNVMKDSLGNDIKIARYKTISCKVTETVQYKSCRLQGELIFINNNENKTIKKTGLNSEWIFQNSYITVFGDLSALSTKTQEKLGNSYIVFPSENEMIFNAGIGFNNSIKETINRNMNIFY